MSVRDKLLVVGPAWVGDMVMAQSLYKQLWRRYAQPEIHVLAPPWSLPILQRMPEVTRGVELRAAHGEVALGKRWRLGRRLRREAYDRAIVLPRSLKAALVPFFASIPVRTGFLGEQRYGLINDVRQFDPVRLDQTVKRFVALGCDDGEALPVELPRPELETRPLSVDELREKLGLTRGRDVVALMPGAEYGVAKQWPIEYYSRLAGRLAGAGFEVWVLGSAKERSLGDAIVADGERKHVHNLCGRTTLDEAVDLLSAAAVAVTNDSGLMHVASAVGTHVVAIYGSSTPDFTPPLTKRKTVFYERLECSPCFKRTCPLHHLRCLRDICVDVVFSAATAVVDERGRAEPAATIAKESEDRSLD